MGVTWVMINVVIVLLLLRTVALFLNLLVKFVGLNNKVKCKAYQLLVFKGYKESDESV